MAAAIGSCSFATFSGAIATEAAGSLSIYVSKIIIFREFGALPLPVIVEGFIVGLSLMVGAFLAKRFVLRLDAEHFRWMRDALMLVSGLTLLGAAIG